MSYFSNIVWYSMVLLLIIGISLKTVGTDEGTPDMCKHSARFSSLTQFIYFDNTKLNVAYFFARKGYYWIIESNEYPSLNNTKGLLPHGFRGDAAFFRQWKRCEDQKKVPMIVVVDGNELDLKYMIYFIHNKTWTQPHNASEDKALSKINLYDGLKTVDTIMNFANIKMGPFADKLGDESIFIISTAQNNSIYYDWVQLTGCLQSENKFTFEGKAIQFFGGLLERGLWQMNKSIDTAMVYLIYPINDPQDTPTEADISLFQANTHYQITLPLKLIQNGFLHWQRKWISVQYYSTWMGCAEGLTPEPPLFIPTKRPQIDKNDTNNGTEVTDDNEEQNSTQKWRPTIIPENERPVPGHPNERDGTFAVTLISAFLVLFVASVLIIIILCMFVFTKKEDSN